MEDIPHSTLANIFAIMWVHTVLCSSHVVSLPAIWKALQVAKYGTPRLETLIPLPLLLMCHFASILMHLSETKHGLIPTSGWLYRHSNFFLDLDRLFACANALFFLWWWWLTLPASSVTASITASDPVWLLLVGTFCLWIGERTINRLLYAVLHVIWHICAFGSVDSVLQRYLVMMPIVSVTETGLVPGDR